MQLGIDYLRRATPHDQYSTAKVDLTLDGVDFGKAQFLFFSAHTDGSVPDKPAAKPTRHMGALDDRTAVRAQEPWWLLAAGAP